MLRNVALVLVAVAVCWVLTSCASYGPALVGPDPCEAMTATELDNLAAMLAAGEFPGVEAIISSYEQHCREDDCLMDRGGDEFRAAWCSE